MSDQLHKNDKEYSIRSVKDGYGVLENFDIKLVCKSEFNAALIRSIMIHDKYGLDFNKGSLSAVENNFDSHGYNKTSTNEIEDTEEKGEEFKKYNGLLKDMNRLLGVK